MKMGLGAVVLLSLLASMPLTSACFRSLRRPSYETYWLGSYYDSRFLSLTCFVLRSFRWTLKFIKHTYESWHVEMEYAKCVSETYGMHIPLFSPPWSKNARMMSGHFAEQVSRNMYVDNIKPRQDFAELPSLIKSDVHEFISSLEPLFLVQDKNPALNSVALSEEGSTQEVMRVAKSLYQILLSLLNEIERVFSRTLGVGVFSCTRKYIKSAFWRWVDAAPFLK